MVISFSDLCIIEVKLMKRLTIPKCREKKKKRFFLYKERKNGLRSMKEKELREQIGKQTKCYLHRWGKQELTRGEKSISGDKINIFTPHMSYRFSSCVYKSRVCHSFL